MAVPPAPTALFPFDRTSAAYQRRWWTLGVLCLSLLVIIVDNSILNVAIPTLQRDLNATTSQLQWMIDSYVLVFAGLLLTAGTLGDKYGRRPALQVGMVIFGLGSLLSAFTTSADLLIFTRGLMGIGGAFIMPATLSIITNTFPPEERGRAISFWAGVAGIGVALGPISGGFLLQHFYWGSIFLVNLPIVAFALISGFFFIPNSKDPSGAKLDIVGALLSIAGLTALVYAIIQWPRDGLSSPTIVGAFGFSAVMLTLFALWEARTEHPMLDVRFFKNSRFSAASAGVTLIFFAMFGATFLLTQYYQFIMGYTPLEAGVRLLPWAATMLLVSPLSARLAERFGTKVVVATGLALAGFALSLMSGLPSQDISFIGDVLWRIILMAVGMALVMAPATESIMGSLPRAKAGVGSAVNDTTRQIGGALGVAIVGSVLTSVYGSRVASAIASSGVPASPSVVESAKESLTAAFGIAQQAPANVRPELIAQIKDAFVSAMHHGVLVSAAAAFLGAIIVWIWLPARGVESTEPLPPGGVDEVAMDAGALPDVAVVDA